MVRLSISACPLPKQEKWCLIITDVRKMSQRVSKGEDII